jgi:hypothetical protein
MLTGNDSVVKIKGASAVAAFAPFVEVTCSFLLQRDKLFPLVISPYYGKMISLLIEY